AGCSSKLQTTVISVSEPPAKPEEVAKVEPVTPSVEAVVQSPVQAETFIGIPPTDIPVEEPVRPVIRPSAPPDIFATPRTTVAEPTASLPLEAPLVAEPVIPPSPIIPTAPGQASPQ